MEPIELTLKPTPIQKLQTLSRRYGCEIYLKRDDLLGVGFGGNKLRKLEYLLAEARSRQAKVIVTSGSLQTNHGMLTALTASKMGMRCLLFLLIEESGEEKTLSGNLLLDDYSGCRVEFVDVAHIMEDSGLTVSEKDRLVQEALDFHMETKIAEYVKEEGLSQTDVYVIRSAGSSPLGILGYVDCVREIREQCSLEFDAVFCGSGSGGTYAGILLGAELYLPGTAVIGVAIEEMNPGKPEFIRDLIVQAAELLSCSEAAAGIGRERIQILHDSVNLGYAVPDPETMAVIEEVARCEGVFLDPIYSGKVMNSVLKYVKSQRIREGAKILVLHSGGGAGLFNRNMIEYRNRKSEVIDRWNHDTD